MRSHRGFTLVELMVSLGLFGIIALAMTSFTSQALQTVGVESRVSLASLEAKNAVAILGSELRMSSSVSPYIPGNVPSLTKCSGSVSVTSTTLKFLVTQDDESAVAASGIRSYYVGYKYDSATGKLLRGEIQGSSTTSCTLPVGDPTSATYAKPLADRVVQIDADNDGTLDPLFSLSGEVLTISIGVEVPRPAGGTSAIQQFVSKAFLRIHA